MTSRRLFAGVVAVFAAAWVTALPRASVSAADATTTVPTSTEAWYETAQCAFPTGCGGTGASAPVNPYPAETLHVGVAGGNETDRTYLSFSLDDVPADASFTGGTLTVPLDTSVQDGSQSADTAHIDACLVTTAVEKARASFATPPAASCDTKAPATYTDVGGPPRLVVDLDGIVSHWTPTSAAIVLVPSQQAVDAHETWHVVFSSHDRANPPSPPASASLIYNVAATATTPNDVSSGASQADAAPSIAGPSAPGGLVTQAPATSFVANASAAAPPPAVASAPPPTAGTPPAPASAVGPAAAGAGGPYQYPLVWLVPLVVLIGFGAMGRALTADLRS